MLYAIVGVLILLVDQFMKFWTVSHVELNTGIQNLIPGFIHLTHIKNFGAVFGILKNAPWLRWAALILLLAVVAVGVFAFLKGWLRSGFARWSGALLLAGLLGNGIDRAIYGYVVDMLEFDFGRLPIFNLADALILIAGIAFCVSVLLGGVGRPEMDEEEDEEEPVRPMRRRAERFEEEEEPARPVRRRAERYEEEEEPVRPVRRAPRTEEEAVPVRRSTRETAPAAAAPRVRRVIDETTVPVPDRSAQRMPQRPVRPAVSAEETPVRAARPAAPAQRPVRPAVSAEEMPVRPARPAAPAASAAAPRPAVRPAAEAPKKAPAPMPAEDEFDLDSILAEFK